MDYDSENDKPEYAARRKITETELLKLRVKGKMVLEVGCGDGRNLKLLEPQQPAVLLGCDTRVVVPMNLTMAKVLHSEETRLPFSAGYFDLVFTVTALQHTSCYEGLIDDICRVSKQTVFIFEDMHDYGLGGLEWQARPRKTYVDTFARFGFQLVDVARLDALIGHEDSKSSGYFKMQFERRPA